MPSGEHSKKVKVNKQGSKGIKVELVSKKSVKEEKKCAPDNKKNLTAGKMSNDIMDLSLGTFKSIDNQINQAENMIAEFEQQLDMVMSQLEKQSKNTMSQHDQDKYLMEMMGFSSS